MTNSTYPLFLTRYSLSSKTAIGVQTKHYVGGFERWRHAFWVERGRPVPGSVRLGNLLVSRWPHYTEALRRVPGFGRWLRPIWSGRELTDRASLSLIEQWRHEASAVYTAPVDNLDAQRMRHIVELIGRPYVLHLWDSLATPLLDSEDFRWLIEHAATVFALSQPLLEDARVLRPDAAELLFVREPTLSRASAPDGGPIRIALIGYLASYRSGLHLLHQALATFREKGVAVELHFVGARRALKRLGEEITREMRATGHRESNAERDAALARCHIAFMPGPLEAPEKDLRSRYSIPSRVLDFMAIGLPVVGTIHPRSATATFYGQYGLSSFLRCGTAEQVAEAVVHLADRERWQAEQRASLEAFTRIDCDLQLARLRAAVELAGRAGT